MGRSSREPDGITPDSRQARWQQTQLQASQSSWNLIFLHHPPYSSSSSHGSFLDLQWTFKEWGTSAVFAGHDHTYERLLVDSLPYFVNGLGGSKYDFGTPLSGSQVRYSEDFGAMLVEADHKQVTFHFITRYGETIDVYSIDN